MWGNNVTHHMVSLTFQCLGISWVCGSNLNLLCVLQPAQQKCWRLHHQLLHHWPWLIDNTETETMQCEVHIADLSKVCFYFCTAKRTHNSSKYCRYTVGCSVTTLCLETFKLALVTTSLIGYSSKCDKYSQLMYKKLHVYTLRSHAHFYKLWASMLDIG